MARTKVYDSQAERYTRLSRMPRLHSGTAVRVTMKDGQEVVGYWGGFRTSVVEVGGYLEPLRRVRVGGCAVYSECHKLSSGYKLTSGERTWLNLEDVQTVERLTGRDLPAQGASV